MRRTALAYARILGYGLLAFISGALSIEWLGTSLWSRAIACLTVPVTMSYAIPRTTANAREVPDGKA